MKSPRKSRIYTKVGDKGETYLLGGKRVSKDTQRVIAYGTLDELNASLGLAASAIKDKQTTNTIQRIQNTLFDIGAELANPRQKGKNTNRFVKLDQSKMTELEKIIDQVDSRLKPISNFILPGGAEGSSRLHFARAITRRAERQVVKLSKKESVNPNTVAYLNRLSDLLFVLARNQNRQENIQDTPWEKD